MNQKYFEQIDKIMRKNLSNRGMDKIRLDGELEKAAKDLLTSSTVLIVTGFCIKDTLTGETDGPIGAVSLADGLEKLGKNVILVTDKYSEDSLSKCCSVKQLKARLEIVPYDESEEFCRKLLSKYQPSHVVAIERPGIAKDGRCYSMRGEELSDIVPNTDILFKESKELSITTLAIGDGGNEIGMGKVSAYIENLVYKGHQICASTSTDYLIIAGVSNWGGHALTAVLSVLTNKMLLHDYKTEILLLENMVETGSVDGCTKKCELTVDGLSLSTNLEVLEEMRVIVVKAINENKPNTLAI